jgi:hypothetical protein
LKALTEELEASSGSAAKTHKGHVLITALGKAIKAILNPPNELEQRVDNSISAEEPQQANEDIAPIPRISDATAIMKARDPTAKRNLIKDTRTHQRLTRNNTPGAVPAIQRVAPALIFLDKRPARATRKLTRIGTEGPVMSVFNIRDQLIKP